MTDETVNATRPKYSPNCGRELKDDNSAVLIEGACDFTWATSCAACDWSGMSHLAYKLAHLLKIMGHLADVVRLDPWLQ
jgi:hypothetical protein